MKSLILAILIIAVFASSSSYGQKVPASWLPGMKLEASYGGGMRYYSYKILIQADTISYMTIESDEGRKHYEKKFTAKELNEILTFLSAHNFHKLNSEENGFTHDKATEMIMLLWNYEVMGATESASSRIIESQRDNFNLTQSYIESLLKKIN